jgi:DNA-binding CsgD family transcriptional regulator
MQRSHLNEEHVRYALRTAIKYRARHLHRDERRRSEILSENARSINQIAERHSGRDWPEEATLRGYDRAVAREFLDGLDDLESRVFWLIAEGKRYRSIAQALGIPTNVARKACGSCERKRQRFQLLYDAGRTTI